MMNMFRKRKEHLLEDCLSAAEADRLPNSQLASQLPADLQDELDAALWLKAQSGALDPRPGWLPASRRRLLARLPHTKSSPWQVLWMRFNCALRSRAMVASLMVLLVLFTTQSVASLVVSAPTWLPGDSLYPLRTAVEVWRLALTRDPGEKALLHIEYANRRMMEAQALVMEGRYDDLSGPVANFNYHTTQAIGAINQLAAQDSAQAHRLAIRLGYTLNKQNGLLSLLAEISPAAAREKLLDVLDISAFGLSAIQQLLEGRG
jgi:hypothetical protein